MEHKDKKILPSEIAILILSTQDIKYRGFCEAILRGWAKNIKSKNIKLYFYSGNYAESRIINDQISVTTQDDLKHTAEKFLAALKILLKHHPEIRLVYRTNLSSYIEIDNFLEFINNKKLNDRTYAGVIGETTYFREIFYDNRYLTKIFTMIPIGKRIKFASGSGFFIGRKRIDELLKAPAPNLRLIDDVMVANTLNIEPDCNAIPLRFDIEEDGMHKVSKEEYSLLIKKRLLFHYRFKTSNRNNDAELMNSFNSAVNRNKICTLEK